MKCGDCCNDFIPRSTVTSIHYLQLSLHNWRAVLKMFPYTKISSETYLVIQNLLISLMDMAVHRLKEIFSFSEYDYEKSEHGATSLPSMLLVKQ